MTTLTPITPPGRNSLKNCEQTLMAKMAVKCNPPPVNKCPPQRLCVGLLHSLADYEELGGMISHPPPSVKVHL